MSSLRPDPELSRQFEQQVQARKQWELQNPLLHQWNTTNPEGRGPRPQENPVLPPIPGGLDFSGVNLNQGKQPVIDWARNNGLSLYDATQPLSMNLGQTNLPPIPQAAPMASGMGKEAIPGLNETAVQTGNPLEDMFPQGMGLGANYADLFGG